jgi:hypothetical protein
MNLPFYPPKIVSAAHGKNALPLSQHFCYACHYHISGRTAAVQEHNQNTLIQEETPTWLVLLVAPLAASSTLPFHVGVKIGAKNIRP